MTKAFFTFLLFVCCLYATCQSTITLGTFTGISSNLFLYTSNSSATYSRSTFVYNKDELTAMPANALIKSITLNQHSGITLNGATVCRLYLKNRNDKLPMGSSTTWGAELAGASLVFEGSVNTLFNNTTGLKNLVFNIGANPGFVYTGENLQLMIEFMHDQSASTSVGFSIYSGSDNQLLYYGNGSLPASTAHILSTFTMKPAIQIAYVSTLPVTLSNLKGNSNGGGNLLSWTTLTEINHAFFEVQRSADGISFTDAALIAAKGNGTSSTPQQYQWQDAGVTTNKFYRLKMIDKNGNAQYSSVIEVAAGKSYQVKAYPDPVTEWLYLEFDANTSNKAEVNIISANGKQVLQQSFGLIKGHNILKINALTWLKGTYYVTASANGQPLFSSIGVLK